VPVSESFPTEGIPTSPYSRHKAAAERRLDRFEGEHPQVVVTRPRPGLVMNGDAASSLLRYGVPGVVPAWAVGWLPLLPLDPAFRVPVVHADDVAAALVTMVRRQAGGAFNLAAATPLDPVILGRVLGAQPVPLPRAVLRAAVATAWRLRLERLDPGWIDLAFSVPLMDSGRARRVLDWNPGKDAEDAVSEVVDGMIHHRRTVSPVLRDRSVRDEIAKLRHGSITRRKLP
jgi:nucleoside-diphosphate-sugar epimerase